MSKHLHIIIKFIFKHWEISLFFLVGFLVYANALSNRFVWDDLSLIVNNKYLQSPDFFREILSGKFFNTNSLADSQEIFYRPLSMLIYAFLYRIFFLNPIPFHLLQLLLHITNTFLIYRLFRYLFSQFKRQTVTVSFLAGIIYLVHPINTEAIAYISSLAEVLYVFWGLVIFNVLLSKHIIKLSSFTAGIILFLLSFLSLLSKEPAVVIIPLGIVLLFSTRKNLLNIYMASSLSSLGVYLYLRYFIAHISNNFTGQFPIMKAPFVYRLQTIPSELMFYLKRFFFPTKLTIAQHWVVENINQFNFVIPLLIVSLIILILILLVKKYKNRVYIFFLLWLILPLGLILNIVPLDMTVAERWFYFPQIGLLGITVFLFLKVINHKPKMFGVYLFVVLLIIILLSIRTVVRNFDWTNSYTLYSSEVKNDQLNFYLENNFATALYDLNDYGGTEQHLLKSISLYQSWFPPYKNLGHLYFFQKKYDLAETYYQQAIRLGSYDPKNYTNYSTILIFQKKYQKAFDLLNYYQQYFPQNKDFVLHLIFLSDKLNLTDKVLYYRQILQLKNNKSPVFVTP